MSERGTMVVTSINRPTPAVLAFAALDAAWPLLLVGDRKTPPDWEAPGARFLAVDSEETSGFALAKLLPENHYCRKNLGYLAAFAAGSPCIFETDDDNAPLPHFAVTDLAPTVTGPRLEDAGWVNVYGYYTQEWVWPRGYPLELLEDARGNVPTGEQGTWSAPVQQFLASGDPDVDAVYRMTVGKIDHTFSGDPVVFGPGSWTPFNSQSTAWWPVAYPLMYLPSFVTFRMTDIWRSFVAQRCLWAVGENLAYHTAAVHQDRNVHDLLRDFRDEVPGYERNREIAVTLGKLDLSAERSALGENLRRCYEALVEIGVVPDRELPLIDAWLSDCRDLGHA